MKNKLIMLLIPLFTFLMMPSLVDAASLRISVSCKDVTLGSTTTCVVKGNSSGSISAIHGEFVIAGGHSSFQSFALGSGWSGEAANGTFDLYTDSNKSGSFTLGTFTLKGNSVGKDSFTVRNVIAADENFSDVGAIPQSTGTFYVKAKTTTTTTTKKTTTKALKTTTKYKNTTAVQNTTVPTHVTTTTTMPPLRLTSVIVDNFEVKYENGVYSTTVNADTEIVTINATAANGISIIGTGKRNLAVGKNLVELVLRNSLGQTNTVQVIITRPEGSGVYDTKLQTLKVVDYEIDFNADTTEYTITVPNNVKELYVIAKAYSEDVIIVGDGLKTLDKGNNTIYVKVSYGDLATTEYVINVKRSYNNIIMWIAIGTLSVSLIGYIIYSYINKKETVEKVVSEKNKIIAAGNRNQQMNEAESSIQVNGEKVIGIGKRTVVPTKVVETRAPEKETVVTQINQVPKHPNVQMVETAPQAQVKIIKKTVVPQPTKVVTTNLEPATNAAYGNDDIVITDIEK